MGGGRLGERLKGKEACPSQGSLCHGSVGKGELHPKPVLGELEGSGVLLLQCS